jgi:uncharacterized membrane protein HdeD (DUF308 family)
MDQHNNPFAALATIISLIFGAFTMITVKDVQAWISITAGIIAIVSGVFAIRYYHFSTKKLKDK